MLVLTSSDVDEVLDRAALTDAVAAALVEVSEGDVAIPPRNAAQVAPVGGMLAAMPGFLPGLGALGAKLVSVFPANTDRPSHQAVMIVFDPATGTPVALLDATLITAARTAAGSAVATRHLARRDARVLAILGTGVQARSHTLAVPPECPTLEEIRVAGRDAENAARFADTMSTKLGRPVRAMPSLTAALDGADVVCACTHSPEPVVRREWIGFGTHVNSVGFNTEGREIDAATIVDARVVVESRAAALAPVPSGANDLLWPIRDGLIDAAHVHAELGEVVAGTRPGRATAEQITLYKSVGIAAEDLAAAVLVLAAARERGVGVNVDL